MHPMNTKLLMASSAVVMGVAGIALSFFPDELLEPMAWAGTPPVLLQMLGALYFGFAMLNWMAKGSLIGGIYSRPVAIGNFAHFMVGGLALAKSGIKTADIPVYALVAPALYLIFAICFGYVLFVGPSFKQKTAA